MFEKYIGIIGKTALFHGVEREGMQAMLKCLEPKARSFKRNDFIVMGGTDYEGVGIILKGQAALSKENAAGDRVVMAFMQEGDVFGEIVAFSSLTKVWPASVQAMEKCEVLFLPKERIIGECEKLCPWHRTLIRNFLRLVCNRAFLLNRKVEYLTIKSIRGKICTYLLEQYNNTGNRNITVPLNRNEMADLLNVSRPSLSREICRMRDEQVIDFHLNSFKILDIEALKAISVL